MHSRWMASTGAYWLVALALLPCVGDIGCGSTSNAEVSDASVEDVGTGDAPEKTITVLPSGVGDERGDEAELDASLESADATLESGVVDAVAGDAAADRAAADGACSCTTPHADTSICDMDGGCLETHCTSGYLDCDGDRSNGCETEFNTLNCGACGTFCNPSHVSRSICSSSAQTCTYNQCLPGYLDCDGNTANGCETPSDSGTCPP